MNKFNVIVGIDIAKLTLAVCILVGHQVEHFEISNDTKGLSFLIKKLKELEQDLSKVMICCEHTGKYMSRLALIAKGEGIFLWAVNPYIISQYQGAKLKRGKTDKDDASRIKDFAFAHCDQAVAYHAPDQVSQELSMLFKLRKHLVDSRQRHLNFRASSLDEAIPAIFNISIVEEVIQTFDQKIKEVEKAIKAFISKHETIKAMYKVLVSVPGIGPVIAQRFLFVTQCFEKFKNWRALAAYIGSAPYDYESGTSVKRKSKTSRKRYAQFKADLHEGVLSVATRKGQLFYSYYSKMINTNIPHLKILNNIINMILKIVFQLIKTGQTFNKHIYWANKKSWGNLHMS
jgi:transposase